jgi:hypothetical protein
MPHLQEKENGWPKVLDIYFENNDTVAFSWEEAITIEETGMYYLWFVICDDELSAATVRGQTTWKNPTGDMGRLLRVLSPLFTVLSRCAACALQAAAMRCPPRPRMGRRPGRTLR